jgi:hypothetical protein
MSDDTKPTEPTGELKVDHVVREFRIPPEGIREIYTNYISLSWTLFDVRLLLAQVVPTAMSTSDDEVKGFAALEAAAVTMAWAEAKAVRDMLTNAIERYEKANGEIKPLKLPA